MRLEYRGLGTAVERATGSKHCGSAKFKPLLEQYRIAGLAVGVTLNGQHYFVNYGLASKQNQQPVNNKTLFELGSVSKLFNATLVGYAQATAKLSLSDHLQANSTQ